MGVGVDVEVDVVEGGGVEGVGGTVRGVGEEVVEAEVVVISRRNHTPSLRTVVAVSRCSSRVRLLPPRPSLRTRTTVTRSSPVFQESLRGKGQAGAKEGGRVAKAGAKRQLEL